MRIVLVSVHTSPAHAPGQGDAGGLNVVMRHAAHELQQLGHEVTLITRAPESHTFSRETLDASLGGSPTLITLPIGSEALNKTELASELHHFTEEMLTLPEVHDANIVHSHYWLSGVASAPVTETLGIPHVLTLHTVAAQKTSAATTITHREPEQRLHAEAALTASTTIVAGSQNELDAITAAYGTPGRGSRVIHPGVDTKFFHPVTTAEKPPTSAPACITVLGRVQPFKGQDLAVDAFIEACNRTPRLLHEAELVIAGEPTPGETEWASQLQERARTSGMPIRFLPAQSRDEAAALLRSSTLVLIPSHAETFGLVALEAQASGVPVIAADTTGLREAVQNGVGGVLVPGRSVTAWANTIEELLHDPQCRAYLSHGAREWATRHDWSQHAIELVELYAQLSQQ